MNEKLGWGLGLSAFSAFMIANGTFSPLHVVMLLGGLVLLGMGLQDRGAKVRNTAPNKENPAD